MISLRGGGCTNSTPGQVYDLKNIKESVVPDFPPDFQNKIRDFSEKIKKSTLTSIDDKGTLMNCFQYFFVHERVFNVLVEKQDLAAANVDLLQSIVTDLMESAKIFVKSNPLYCYYCVQIVAWIWRVLFWFYTRNERRFLSVEEQQEFIGQVGKVEQQLGIEGGGDIYGNSIKYELFVIKTILTIFPNNSKEGEEILNMFAKGAITSMITMTVSEDLKNALQSGVIYAVNEGVKMYLKSQYHKIHQIEALKWQIIDAIVASSNSTRSLIKRMVFMYKQIESSSWEIQNCWIKSIGSIISLKPHLDKSELDLDFEITKQLLSDNSLIPLSTRVYQINLDAQKINLSKAAKQLYDKVPCLGKLAEMQAFLLKGNQSFPNFEQYNQKFTDMNVQGKNETSPSQYFVIQFKNLQIDYYIKKIDDTDDMICKIHARQELINFKLSSDHKMNDQNLEHLFLAKEKISQLIYKLMDINIYYITLNFMADQWNQYTCPEVDFKKIEKETFTQQIIIQQLNLVANIVEEQQRFENQLNITKNKEHNIDNSKITKIKEQLIKNSYQYDCGKIEQDVIQQAKKLNSQLSLKRVTSLEIQNILSMPHLEYAIQQRLQQCTSAFLIHQSNIRVLIQIKTNLKIMISMLEDCEEDEYKDVAEQMVPIQEILLLLIQQVIRGNKGLSEDLYDLVKQINPKELDKINRKFKPPSDEIMKTYQIQHYEAINVNLPMMTMLSTFASYYKTKLETFNVRTLGYKIVKLQQILGDLTYQLADESKGKRQFIQFMKSITLLDSQSNQEQMDFWQKFKKFLEETTKNPSNSAITNLQLQLTNRQQQLQLSYQAMISFNPYDIQATQQYEQEDNALNSIVKLIKLMIEIDKRSLTNSQLYLNNLLEKINSLSDAQFAQAEKISKAQESVNKQVDKKQEQVIVEYERKLDNFQLLSKQIENNLKYMKTELGIIKEVQQACTDVGSNDDWLKQVETYQFEQFVEFCNFQLTDCLVDCNLLFKVNTQIQFELMQTIQPTLQNQQSLQDQLSEIIQSDRWKIRECMAMQLIRLSGNCIRLEVKQYAEMIILRMKIYETHKKVRALLNAPQNATLINQVLQQHWPSQQEQIVQEIKSGMKQLNSLLYELQQEQDVEKRKKLQHEYQQQENEIQEQLSNVQEVGNALGITMLFIQDLKKDLAKIDQKITEIQENLTNMNTDLQFLRGKTVYQLLEIRKSTILRNKKIVDAQSIYIKIRCVEKKFQSEDDENADQKKIDKFDQATYLYNADNSEQDGEINEFLIQDKKTLLIHGPAGSGKSTASRKIEEYFWELFEKQTTADVRMVPIVIQLPSLQDPVHSAIYETLKSDSYKFDTNQIRELKDEIDKQKLKLLIIMDSYDELHQDYIGINLIRTNKLSAWGHKNIVNYPKVLVTTRSEVLNKSDYHEWFLPEGADNVKHYKEARLERFDKDQRDTYIDCYLSLSVKKVLYESYALMANQQNEFQLFENYLQLWSLIKLNFKDSKDEQLLSEQQTITIVEQMLKDKNISIQNAELKRNLKVQLAELKSGHFYKNTIQLINIEHILETPFMMEIVVQVLPTLIKQKSQPEFVKPHFIMAFAEMLNKINPENVEANENKAHDAWLELTKDQSFFEDFSITMHPNKVKSKVSQAIKQAGANAQALKKLQQDYVDALMSQKLTQFDFYRSFFDLYFEKQINKLKEAGQAFDYVSLTKELWKFAKNLAVHLSSQNKTQVEYKAQGLLYKKETKGWEDEFFDDDCKEGTYKKMFRSCIPMKQQTNTFSFNHKSLQEFLVAKDFVDRMEYITQQVKSLQLREEQQIEYENNQFKVLFADHFINQKSWSVDFMKGACNFVTQRVGRNELIKNLMHRTIDLTKQADCKFIMFGSNSLFLLQKMGESFMDRNIQGINVQDIDLSASNFAHCNLDNSKFNNVNIAGINVFFASLRKVKWTNTYVAQLPPKEQKMSITKLFYQKNNNLVMMSENQISNENGDAIESYAYKIKKSLHWHDKEYDYLYLIFEKSIIAYDLNKSKKLDEQQFNHKIAKVKQNAHHIIVLLGNSEIYLLKIGEQTTQRKLEIKSKIQETLTDKAEVKITNIWPSKDSTEMTVKCNDLYSVQINEVARTMKSRRILPLQEVGTLKYHSKMKLALLDSFKLLVLEREPKLEYEAKQSVQLIYLHHNLKEFIVFTNQQMSLMGLNDLKIKKEIDHTLEDFKSKSLSHNNEMLITLHYNKVAIWNVKSFEQIQVLSHTATCCAMDRQMKVLALGNDRQLQYQDLKSLTSQKQLNFKDVIFANKSSNFIGMTTDNEIYYFNVQNEVKWNLLMKAQEEVFIFLSPNGERALISSQIDKLFILFDCLKGSKQEKYGFCKNNIIERENQEILFIKGHQFFSCEQNVATIRSPIKRQIDATSTSYFKVRQNLLSITMDRVFQQQQLEKYTQSELIQSTLGNVTLVITYQDEYMYVIDNQKIVDNQEVSVYNSYENIVDCSVMEGGLVILHKNRIRLISLGRTNLSNPKLRPRQFNVQDIHQVLSIQDSIYGASNDKLIIWNIESLEIMDTIQLNGRVNKMIIINQQYIAIATNNSIVEVWDHNAFTISNRLQGQPKEVVDLAYNNGNLVSRGISNQIVCWDVDDEFHEKYQHQLDEDPQKYKRSQIFIGENKSYIYWLTDCQVFRQQLTSKFNNNQQMVANLRCEYHKASQFAATQSIIVVSDIAGRLHISHDQCQSYQQFTIPDLEEDQNYEYSSLSISNDEQYVLTIYDGSCCIWSIKDLSLKIKLTYTSVQQAYFLESGDVFILSDNSGTEIFTYNIDTDTSDKVAVLKNEVLTAGPNLNGFSIAQMDSSMDVYAKRRYQAQLKDGQELQEKGKYNERYVRISVFNNSSNQPIQSYDTDCEGAYIQSHIKLSLVELFQQPQHK